MYAAHAAGALEAVDVLEQLGRDPHDNVREAALSELVAHKRPEATRVAVEALSRPDYQLIVTASRALRRSGAEGDRHSGAAAIAGARHGGEERDLARSADGDPRTAQGARRARTARRLAAIRRRRCGPTSPTSIRLLAARAADMLQEWQKGPAAAAPERLARAPPVDGGGRRHPERAHAVRHGRARTVRAAAVRGRSAGDRAARRDPRARGLLQRPHVPSRRRQLRRFRAAAPAPTNTPAIGLYMRDEVGLRSHQRGTVGISTRGRDTGDAQIFVNLIDSPRLDHLYTVFAEVVSGMDVVDAIVEGDVIERVEVDPARPDEVRRGCHRICQLNATTQNAGRAAAPWHRGCRSDRVESDARRPALSGGPAGAARRSGGADLRSAAARTAVRARGGRSRFRPPRPADPAGPHRADRQHQRSLRVALQAVLRRRRFGAGAAAQLSALRTSHRARIGRGAAVSRSSTTAAGASMSTNSRRGVDDRTRAILVVSPNNPTGSFLHGDDLAAHRRAVRVETESL